MRICSVTMAEPEVSADAAVETCAPFVHKSLVMPFREVVDFGAARSQLLDTARENGFDWAVMIDTDERIIFNHDGRTVQRDLETTEADVIMVWHEDGTYAKERFFRLGVEGHYVGPVHEAYITTGTRATWRPQFMTFTELPKTAEQIQFKLARDRDILLGHVDTHYGDPRWWYYLGDTEANLGMVGDAIEDFTTCWEKNGWPEESAWAAYRVAVLESQRGNESEAVAWCCRGLERDCSLPELPWLAGWCSYRLGRYEQAIYWSSMALKINGAKRLSERVIFSYPPAHHEGPWDVMRWAYRKLGLDGYARQMDSLFESALAKRTNEKAPPPEGGDGAEPGSRRLDF